MVDGFIALRVALAPQPQRSRRPSPRRPHARDPPAFHWNISHGPAPRKKPHTADSSVRSGSAKCCAEWIIALFNDFGIGAIAASACSVHVARQPRGILLMQRLLI
ncbi:hypothetical protein EVAR_8117_1 [Eumeta japonica]|uniref:Uncharacterized protein n=1 Tax=Eumeta variegata TaxID=151549 RepID=A0A4C1TSR7_EUMVA|nr:hypothetical protein EVAR_8117_1 [Eumeta japonica]